MSIFKKDRNVLFHVGLNVFKVLLYWTYRELNNKEEICIHVKI